MADQMMMRIFVIVALAAMPIALVSQTWALEDPDCTTVYSRLKPCFDYFTGIVDAPSKCCCSNLWKVLKTSSVYCYCPFLDRGASWVDGNVNRTRSLQLPETCGFSGVPSCEGTG